jgi:iron complex outermembrane receptor protein
MEDKRGGRNVEPGGSGVVTNCSNVNNPLDMCTDDGAGNPLTYVMTRDTLIGGGFMFNADAKYSEVTPTVSLTRHLTPGDTIDSGIIYGTISKGYLTGAFNDELNPYNPEFSAEGQALVESLIAYNPEFVTNYELGFKATLADGAVRISSAIFYMDYSDKQEAITVENPDGSLGPDPNLEYTQNAASVDISGIELELRASPWDGGFISIDAGVLDTEYADFSYTDLRTGELVTPALTQIQNRTPEWTITATVEHQFQLANGGTLTPQLGMYSQAGLEWWPGLEEGERSDLCYQDSFAKWRTRLTYEPANANWQASLYGSNITDEEILFRCQENRSGMIGRWYQAPSQWGVEFHMRFGNN